MRIFPFARRDDSGTIRTDEARPSVALQGALHLDHVAHGNAFGDGHHECQPGIRAFQDGVGGKGWRHKDGGSRRAGLFHRFSHGVEDGDFDAAMLKALTALAGGDAGDDLGAVIQRELRVPGAKAAGDALDQDFRVGLDKDGHGEFNFVCLKFLSNALPRSGRGHGSWLLLRESTLECQ